MQFSKQRNPESRDFEVPSSRQRESAVPSSEAFLKVVVNSLNVKVNYLAGVTCLHHIYF